MHVVHGRCGKAPSEASGSAAWLGSFRPALASLEFVHNSEERTVLGHHTHTPIATEAAGWVHLQLNILLGSIAGGVPEGIGSPSSPNPAERRAERLLAARLTQLSSTDSPEAFTSGIDLVRKACYSYGSYHTASGWRQNRDLRQQLR